MNEELDEMITKVVDQPRRKDPQIDIKDMVMRRVAAEPTSVQEKDFGLWSIGLGIAILIAIVVGVDYFFLSDVSVTTELGITEGMTGEYSVSYREVLISFLIIPLIWLALQEPERQSEEH